MVAAPDSLNWLAPSPTWSDFGALTRPREREQFLRPAILRFSHDGFMDELLSTLSYHPDRLGEWRAMPESWDKPMRTPVAASELLLAEPISALSLDLARKKRQLKAGASSQALAKLDDEPAQRPLKLYQPAQLRHYLVSASLVCQRPGLPDRRVDAAKQERAGFVMRRIVLPEGQTVPGASPESWEELGFVQEPGGPCWRAASGAAGAAARLLENEERLPFFSLGFEPEPGRKRRVFAGTIPVGRREAYLAAPVRAEVTGAGGGASGAATTEQAEPRRLFFQLRVTSPWNELVQQCLDEIERSERARRSGGFLDEDRPQTSDADVDASKRLREQVQTLSWYVLLDFERFLFDHLPRVHAVLAGASPRSGLDPSREEPLLAWLERCKLASFLKNALGTRAQPSLFEALRQLVGDASIGERLESVDVPYDVGTSDAAWPAFLFPLASAFFGNVQQPPNGASLRFGPFPFLIGDVDLSQRDGLGHDETLGRVSSALAELEELVEQALPPASSGRPPPELHVQSNPVFDPRGAWFTIRCVYERPNCGPFEPPVLSAPTEPFQLAAFFDSDAPVRPVRIALPVDISPAGLRKFPKGATLMISDLLCGQLKKIRQLTLGDLVLSVLPWPFHKDLPSVGQAGPCRNGDTFGMFCSLSIPIVTLVALVLMMIMVALFDIFFRWLPFLFFCFPVRLFSGKKP